jgi:fructan beta-fructosidase
MKENMIEHYKKKRPVWHYSIANGWMNDPNGLIYYNGYYHLCFQYFPDGLTHGPMHWGHVMSKDFIHWKSMSIALYPDEMGEVYSGCMVYDKENKAGFGESKEKPLIAAFTQHRVDTDGQIHEVQCLAYSLDGGESFIKNPDNPILTDSNMDFRDPKIIYFEPAESFVMLLARGLEICFYESKDLCNWSYTGSFRRDPLDGEKVWECPDLLKFEKDNGEAKWALVFSTNTQGEETDAVFYFLGSFDGHKFIPEDQNSFQKMDFGSDFYAAATYANTTERKLLIAWMNNWNYAERTPAIDFRGSMTIPRELYLKSIGSRNYICQRPVRELINVINKTEKELTDGRIDLSGNPCMIEITGITGNVDITILNQQQNTVTISYNEKMKKITLDRTHCNSEYSKAGLNVRSTVSENPVTSMMILLDITSVELFINGGELCGTMLCFWSGPYQLLTTTDQALKVKVLE